MKNRKILHLVFSNIGKDTGFSQRIRRQKKYIFDQLDLDLKTLNVVSDNEVKNKNEYERLLEEKDYKDVNVHYMTGGKLYKFLKVIRSIYIESKLVDIIYTETHISSTFWLFISMFSPKKKWVVDIHGVAPEERVYLQKESIRKTIKLNILKWIERAYLRKCDHIFVVSEELKKHYKDNYGIKCEKIDVVPNCIYEIQNSNVISNESKLQREKLSDQYKTRDRMLFVYAGGIGVYHKVKEIVDWHQEYLTDLGDLLLLIPENYVLKDITWLNVNSNKSVIVKQVKHKYVSDFLSIADFGIIFRDDDLLNIVADPTKVPEYLSEDLNILHTSSVKTVPNNKSNISLGNFNDLYNIDKATLTLSIRNATRTTENSEYVNNKYCWSIYVELYKSVFL
ncbi:glycosyltransferase [Vibrio cyclitrophicus 1F53]|uniref:glycosyltransferase n=1 Tax=Vibrio cyclitrophicus TaxID=47951 RepID=UPI00031013B9|nr:glycosyltransferase [Vibrio cyclitrophicus]OEF32104.1 hypothetical protein OA7_16340 [Vibrio cyclitrophicus 1F53]PMH33108.1 hypothetical protein BCU72_15005 [Vibrio cyclitrophicus]